MIWREGAPKLSHLWYSHGLHLFIHLSISTSINRCRPWYSYFNIQNFANWVTNQGILLSVWWEWSQASVHKTSNINMISFIQKDIETDLSKAVEIYKNIAKRCCLLFRESCAWSKNTSIASDEVFPFFLKTKLVDICNIIFIQKWDHSAMFFEIFG